MKIINRFIYFTLLLILVAGVAANLFFEDSYIFNYRNATIIIPALIIVAILFMTKKGLEKVSKKTNKIIFTILIMTIIIFQILILINFEPSLIHDAFRILTQSYDLINGKDTPCGAYFDQYPNNVTPTIINSWIYGSTTFLTQSPVIGYKLIAFLMTNIFLGLVFTNIWMLTKKWTWLIISAVVVLLLPNLFTYNLMILYTDTPAMIGWAGGILIIQLAIQNKLNNYMMPLILIFFYLFFSYKASLIAIFGALLIIAVRAFVARKNYAKNIFKVVIAFVIAVGVSFPINKAINNAYQFKSDNHLQIPVTHWVAMGLNPETRGLYNQLDVLNTLNSGNTIKQKSNYDINLARQRIEKMGPIGLAKHFFIKYSILLYGGNLWNRYYGSFVNAPGYFQDNYQSISKKISNLNRIGYLVILISGMIAVIRKLFGPADDEVPVLALVVLAGLSFYALLWEVNPRYGEIAILPLGLLTISPLAKVKANLKIMLPVPIIVALIAFAGTLIKLKPNVSSIPQIVNGNVQTARPPEQNDPSYVPVMGNSSNYGLSYGRGDIVIEPGKSISQNIQVSSNSYVRLRLARDPNQEGILTIAKNNKIFYRRDHFSENNFSYINHQFKKGIYKITWKNNTDHQILIVSQSGRGYPLDRHHLTNNKDRYLIYQLQQLKQ